MAEPNDPRTSADAPLSLAGRVLTLADGDDRGHEAVSISAGKIDRVGSLRDRAGACLDFGERVVMPAFVDPHTHLEITSVARHAMADCRAPGHRSIADVQQTLRERAEQTEPGEWLMGEANLFFSEKIEDGRLPTRAELDAVSERHPIILRAGGHTSVINSRALEMADLTRFVGTQGMMGGAVVKLDETGSPTGVISELDKALDLPALDEAGLRAAIEAGIDSLLLPYGVTAIGEISETRAGMAILEDLIGSGAAPLRLAMYLWAPGTCTVDEACAWPSSRAGADYSVTGLKLFADGGYSARNAAARTPYLKADGTPEHLGPLNLSAAEIAEALGKCDAAGLQIAVHGNGERAQDTICDGILASGVKDPRRPRIEHAGNVLTDFGATERWREAGALPVPQPVFLYNFGEFLTTYLGDEVAHGRFPFRSLLDAGWRISGSSDCHLGCEERQTNPLFGVWCCIAREGFHGTPIEPEQEVSVTEALRMHSLFAAEAIDQEGVRGSLEPGKRADVIVLDRDPRQVPTAELPDVAVDFVYVDGRQVYARPGATPPRQVEAA
jgi:hypothetical protein